MSLLVLPHGPPITALRNNANACVVDCGSAAMLDNLATITILFWYKNSSLASGRTLINKRSGGSGGWDIDTTDTSGNFRFFNDRATSNLTYTTSSTPLVPSGGWKMIAVTKDQAAGATLIVHIYRGDLLTPAAEVTYSAQTDGSGTFKDESAQNLKLCGEGTFGLVGDMGPMVIVNRVLSLADIRVWQRTPAILPAGTVGAWFLGAEGTGLVLDRSGNGNNGTITSLLPVPGLPLRSLSRWRGAGLAGRTPAAVPRTPVFCCGAECGVNAVGAAPGSGILRHWDALTGSAPTFVAGRRGRGSAYRFAPSAAANYWQRTISGTSYVARFAFKFSTLPDINSTILSFHTVAGGFPNLRYRTATTDVIPGVGATTTGASAFVITTGVWYVVTVTCDVSSGTRTFSARIKQDGALSYTDLGTASSSVAASTLDAIRIGAGSGGEANTASLDVDDMAFSATAADYPYPDGFGVGLIPYKDGTHSFNAVADFKYNDTTDMPSTSPTDTYSYIDDPLDNITDFISIAGASSGEYLEWLLQRLPFKVQAIYGMEVVSAHHAATTSANKVSLRLVDGVSLTDVIADGDQSQTTITYSSKQVSIAPSSAEPFTADKVNAMRFRLTSSYGTTDISPAPYLDGLRCEVDCLPATDPVLVTQAPMRAALW